MAMTKQMLEFLKEAKKDKKGVGRFIGSASQRMFPTDRISTGFVGLDLILGGGVPKGRILHIYGGKSAGKTTLSLNLLAQFQKLNLQAVYMDLERGMTLEYLKQNGVDTDSLVVLESPADGDILSGEELGQFAIEMVKAKAVDILVLDSVAFFTPNSKLTNDLSKTMPANRARAMTAFLELMVPVLAWSGCVLVLINHQSGTLQSDHYGNEILTAKGGKMVGYASSIELKLHASTKLNREGSKESDPRDRDVTITVDKNKVGGKQFMRHTLSYHFGYGFDKIKDLIQTARKLGVITNAGAWLRFKEIQWNGIVKATEALETNSHLLQVVIHAVQSAIQDGVIPDEAFGGGQDEATQGEDEGNGEAE